MGDRIPDNLLSLTRLAKFHDVSKFDCATEEEHTDLNEFLKEDAMKYQENGLAVTYLCIYQEHIVGYITLCSDAVKMTLEEGKDICDGIRLKDVPGIKIARLAVDKNYHQKGVGKYLILRALILAKDMRNNIGTRVVTVEAKRSSVDYYLRMGFRQLESYSGKKREHPYLYIDIMTPTD